MHERQQTIYLAGGCFWGVEGYFQRVAGVIDTMVGYANGTKAHATYQEVCSGAYHFAETVRVVYDIEAITTEEILMHFLRIVDPYSINQQGNDRGVQYRSGIYYESAVLGEEVKSLMKKAPNAEKFVIEIKPLTNFYPAEDAHQDYLKKNPTGYCHISLISAKEPLPVAIDQFKRIK
ncbi:peptide-methionine (S)-S-oxide reductase MsrA [Allofustis seminis]|uniref:peptide-methionine (S)-S-oxide reductase MsrA n=1 Tax=Allofustis seminis TaxID=166939 RepID=UPI0003787FAA|nr:peptide-methionine (S)-S-oxide reductase MsrA [Allofustis seminis]